MDSDSHLLMGSSSCLVQINNSSYSSPIDVQPSSAYPVKYISHETQPLQFESSPTTWPLVSPFPKLKKDGALTHTAYNSLKNKGRSWK